MNFRKSLLLLASLMVTFGATAAMAAEGEGGDAYASLGAALAIGRWRSRPR
jgi:hypothetical protein